MFALGWPDVPHTPITPSTPTASFLPTIPCLRVGSNDFVDDSEVLTSTIRPRSSSLALTSFFSSPDLRTGGKRRPALPFPHLLNTQTIENNARDSEPNTPTTFTSFLSTSSDCVPFEFSDGSGSTLASPSTSPSRSRNESRSCSYEQVRDERPLPPTPWVLIDRCDEEAERDRTPTPGPGFFAKKSPFDGLGRLREDVQDDQELNLPPSRFSLCSSAGTPCRSTAFPSASQTATNPSSRFGLSKVRKAVKMPSKSNLKLSSSPSKEKDRSRRISGISARTSHTTHTNCTATTAFTGTSFAASTHSSFVSTKSSSGFGSRIKRLLGLSVTDLNAVPPMPSLPPSTSASAFAPNYASARTPAPSLRRTHASMPAIDKDPLSPMKTALAHLPSFKEKKRLVIRLLASSDDHYGIGRLSPSQEERAFECIKEWCSVRPFSSF